MAPRRILGAVLAGGAGRRFGSDKALHPLAGRSLIERSLDALRPAAAALVICGRAHGEVPGLADRPAGGAGPLAGLNAALAHAAAGGFDGVLCVPVDVHPLPDDLAALLVGDQPAVLADQHLIGWWPATLAPALDAFLAGGGRAAHRWIAQSGARRVADPPGLVNISTPDDAARLG